MSIQSYKDVSFPFDTEFANDGGKIRLLACVSNDYATHIIGYSYYDDPLTNCSQVLEWDENGKFGVGQYPTMDLVPPPGAVESQLQALEAEIAEIRQRLDENPDAPEAWRSGDERRLGELQRKAANISAPHIWAARDAGLISIGSSVNG